MRITDPRWPAVREAARILLREENVALEGPDWLDAELHQLSITMGDRLPSRLQFPSCLPDHMGALSFYEAASMRMLVRCDFAEPPPGVVWIPLRTAEAWAAIKSTALDLMEAGYPGCVGCAGKEAEVPWDETANRERLQNHHEFLP